MGYRGMTVGATPLLPYHMDAPSFTLERSTAGGGQTWQNPFVERVIGSIRRECLDHFVILSEAHLRRLLCRYRSYYNRSRPHQALENNGPIPRQVQLPSPGRIRAVPEVGGLRHRCQRVA